MKGSVDKEQILFEHRFWLQILGDHGRFILTELSPEEGEEIKGAKYFIEVFDSLLEEARRNLGDEEVAALTRKAEHYARELRAFKLNLLRQHLVGNIKLGLSPTFINHMINELEEYLRVLGCIAMGQPPLAHPVHNHLLWLLDGAGHAAAIASNLDEVEKKLKDKAMEFNEDFKNLYLKAIEMSGYLRTEIGKFPALTRFNFEAEGEMKKFMEYLTEILDMRIDKEALGTILPLMLDHMLREECYYLTKLSMVSEVEKPGCNPTKPRLEV